MKEFINFNSSKISWFRCGGDIELFIIVETLEELQNVYRKYNNYFIENKVVFIGAGSNILIREKGFKGIAIKLTGNFSDIKITKEDNESCFINAGCSVLSKQLSNYIINNNFIGCEFLDTIPGSIGGMVKMNAGCFGKEIKDILYSVDIFKDGVVKTYLKDEIDFSYRHSDIADNSVVLSATFIAKKGTEEEVLNSKNKIEEMRNNRKENQVIGFTCGSTFKNPAGYSVWKLLDEVGMRGYKIGDAEFSNKHCNFIINNGKATASDIENLINTAKQKVKEKFNIELEVEIRIFGER